MTDYEALAQRLDPELLLDNAACATQNRELLRDDNTGEESQLRMLIRLNVYDPMAAALRELAATLGKLAVQREREERLLAAGWSLWRSDEGFYIWHKAGITINEPERADAARRAEKRL
jgi:hypothetical protein